MGRLQARACRTCTSTSCRGGQATTSRSTGSPKPATAPRSRRSTRSLNLRSSLGRDQIGAAGRDAEPLALVGAELLAHIVDDRADAGALVRFLVAHPP